MIFDDLCDESLECLSPLIMGRTSVRWSGLGANVVFDQVVEGDGRKFQFEEAVSLD